MKSYPIIVSSPPPCKMEIAEQEKPKMDFKNMLKPALLAEVIRATTREAELTGLLDKSHLDRNELHNLYAALKKTNRQLADNLASAQDDLRDQQVAHEKTHAEQASVHAEVLADRNKFRADYERLSKVKDEQERMIAGLELEVSDMQEEFAGHMVTKRDAVIENEGLKAELKRVKRILAQANADVLEGK